MEMLHFAHSYPYLLLLSAGLIALLGDLFCKERWPAFAYVTVQGSLLLVVSFLLKTFSNPEWIGFHGLMVDDAVARLLMVAIAVSGFLVFWYSRHYVEERAMPSGEYYVLALLSIIGMMVLVSAHSFLTIYLGLELLSLPLYALVAFRRDESDCVEAALKYFVMGAMASGMLLYGLSLFYGATGSLDLAEVAKAIAAFSVEQQPLLALAMVFIVAGFGFKLAAAPFHMWAPDVYSGAPMSVTLLLATCPKIAAFGMVVRFLTLGFSDLISVWQPLLIALALLSIFTGNLLALAQTHLKRLLAYSAIAQAGYMLLGFIAGSVEGYAAAAFYTLSYVLTALAAFGLLTIMSRGDVEVTTLDDLQGLSVRQPWLALLMALVVLSMAGVPPLVGFWAKLFVLKALIDIHLVWLAAVALFMAVWGAFYYLRIIKVMYFDSPLETAVQLRLARPQQAILSLNTLSLLALGIFPGLLLSACQWVFS